MSKRFVVLSLTARNIGKVRRRGNFGTLRVGTIFKCIPETAGPAERSHRQAVSDVRAYYGQSQCARAEEHFCFVLSTGCSKSHKSHTCIVFWDSRCRGVCWMTYMYTTGTTCRGREVIRVQMHQKERKNLARENQRTAVIPDHIIPTIFAPTPRRPCRHCPVQE